VPVVVLFADSAARAVTSWSTAGGTASAGDETSQAATSSTAGILGTRSAWVRARGQGEHARGAGSGACARGQETGEKEGERRKEKKEKKKKRKRKK